MSSHHHQATARECAIRSESPIRRKSTTFFWLIHRCRQLILHGQEFYMRYSPHLKADRPRHLSLVLTSVGKDKTLCQRSVCQESFKIFLACWNLWQDVKINQFSEGICSYAAPRLSSVRRLTRRLYALRSCKYSSAASGFAGLPQFGSVSSDWIEVRTELTVYDGLHLFWMMSRHRVPSWYTGKTAISGSILVSTMA
jgi:hypothetical protein